MIKYLIILFLCVFNLYATTYYLDATDGDNGNSGTSPAQAWQTIAYLETQALSPDDIVLFQRGEIWREQYDVQYSGTSGNHIFHGAYGIGAKPIIKPSSDIGANWTTYSGSGDSEVWYFEGTEEIRVLWLSDQWVVYGGSGRDPAAGQWKQGVSAKDTCFYNPVGSTDPNTLDLAWGKGGSGNTFGINIDTKDYITIDNIEVSNASEHGIRTGNANYINITNCHSKKNGSHVQSYPSGVGNNISLQYDTHNVLVEDCEADSAWDIGLSVEGLGSDPSDIIFRRCISHHNGSGLGTGQAMDGFSVVSASAGHYADSVILDGCQGYSNGASGLRSIRATDLIVRYSTFYDNYWSGIVLKTLSTGNIYYNLIYDNNQGNTGGDYSGNLEFWDGVDSWNIYNNVIAFNTGTKGTGIKVKASTNNNANYNVKNNIIKSNHYADLRIQEEWGANVVFTNNTYSDTNGIDGYIIRFDNEAALRTYTVAQFASYQTTESLDANSFTADPLWVNAPTDFTPLKTSPGIDVGETISGFHPTTDFAGNLSPFGAGVDIGAYEYRPLSAIKNQFPIWPEFPIYPE